jgi:hypothetical protein
MPPKPSATYAFRRLGFRADVIEPLAAQEHFRIETPDGTFQMSKADFRRVFANVVKSSSYRDDGLYHYPTPPAKALPFRVS